MQPGPAARALNHLIWVFIIIIIIFQRGRCSSDYLQTLLLLNNMGFNAVGDAFIHPYTPEYFCVNICHLWQMSLFVVFCRVIADCD